MKCSDAYVLDLAAAIRDVIERLNAAPERGLALALARETPMFAETERDRQIYQHAYIMENAKLAARDLDVLVRRLEEQVGDSPGGAETVPALSDPDDLADQVTAVRARLMVVP